MPTTLPTSGRSAAVYGPGSVKRQRRSKSELQAVLDAVQKILAGEEGQITIRHLFYRLVGLRVIEKTEHAYKALGKLLSNWRWSGDIDFGAFSDGTRYYTQHRTFDSVEEALQNTAATYRRNLWGTQDVYIEVWTEKNAMRGIVASAALPWGVPVFAAVGFTSLTSLHSAADTYRRAIEAGKRPIIYHLGDYDPSGVCAGEAIVRAFQRKPLNVEVQFTRLAVTADQIRDLNLPTRPVKMSDSRSAAWTGGESVELDCMPAAEIRALVRDSIIQHIDARAWEVTQAAEASERELLQKISRKASR